MAVETVSVCWGEEVFNPVPYNSFHVGPFTYTTIIQEGETPADAIKRAYKEIDAVATKIFIYKRNGFFERIGTLKP